MEIRAITIDIKKSLSIADIHNIVANRDVVLKRFGPIFRDPSRLTRQDYLDFLSFDHNRHWTDLERLGRRAADDMENLRVAVTVLVDETRRLSDRFDHALSMLQGVGKATLTAILLLAYPDRYGVWNGTSEPEMGDYGLWPTFPRGASEGDKYEIINSVLLDLANEWNVDLWTLDALWWAKKLERKNTGRYLDAWEKSIWRMADMAEQTAKQSYGQTVERTVKNKDLRLSKETLIKLMKNLLDEKDYRCAISGLLLQPDGPDEQLLPSLDRIDSGGHYDQENLQVVARFINRWKSDASDTEFRRLMAMVRGE